MALTFTSPADNIIFQEGTSAYNYKASGTIKAGQLVYPVNTMEVKAVDGANKTGIVGVADYDVVDEDYIAVWGPGNIVRCKSSGSITVGAALCGSVNGHVYTNPGTAVASTKIGVALETVATDTAVRVLLT